MSLLTKEMILGAQDLKRETVAVPEWGGDVLVSEMSGEAYADYLTNAFPENESGKKASVRRFSSVVVACCIIDADGVRLFSIEDVEALGRKSRKALERVFAVADKLNCLTEKAIQAAEKN